MNDHLCAKELLNYVDTTIESLGVNENVTLDAGAAAQARDHRAFVEMVDKTLRAEWLTLLGQRVEGDDD